MQAPTVIVDASWQECRAGAGLVLTVDGLSTARAYTYMSPTSVTGELHGIRLALGWLQEIGRGPGTVYCDCEGAIRQRSWLGWRDHNVVWLKRDDRDVRYLRAHQIGVLAREMAKRLNMTTAIGPLPVPLAIAAASASVPLGRLAVVQSTPAVPAGSSPPVTPSAVEEDRTKYRDALRVAIRFLQGEIPRSEAAATIAKLDASFLKEAFYRAKIKAL